MQISEFDLSDIVFREDLYPRIEHNPQTVQSYAEDLSILPPIEVNQNKEIIDGWHRWTAHKKMSMQTIKVVVTKTISDAHFLELAIERNARHGLCLSREDKKSMARRIYHVTPESERNEKKKHLASILSVDERTIRDWLSRIDKDAKEARNKRIFDLWLACWTQEEIAAKENVHEDTVNEIVSRISEDLPKSVKVLSDHADPDFQVPLYNIWKWQEKTSGSKHAGNSESTILDNLLYLYTKPFDIVIDPFAGGGSTIDICRKRLRRYWVADREPIVEREKDIRKASIQEGLPSLNKRWSDVRLVGQSYKNATVTCRLAKRANLPCFAVLYKLSAECNPADTNWPDIQSFC